MERLTWPFRYPKSVPVMQEPKAAARVSGKYPLRRVGNLLAAGVKMGNDRKTDRRSQNTFNYVRIFRIEVHRSLSKYVLQVTILTSVYTRDDSR